MEISKPRIGLIAGNRVVRGLSFESQVFPLRQSNYRSVLRHGKIDFVLIEIRSNSGNHTEKYNHGEESSNAVRSVISLAKEFGIPIVAWITNEEAVGDVESDLIKLVDAIFCVSKELVRKINILGLEAHLLPPCTQPAIFNPINEFNITKEKEKEKLILVDDEEFLSKSNFYEELETLGCKYILNELNRNCVFELGGIQQGVFHGLGGDKEGSESARKSVFDSIICYVSAGCDRNDRMWIELDAAASGVFVIHIGEIADHDPIYQSSIECKDTIDALTEIIRFQKDDLYRQRLAHKSWRQVTLKHTFANRLATICESIGLPQYSKGLPKVSIIAPTLRRNKIINVINTFNSFDYPNKELIVIYNGDESVDAIRREFSNIQANLKIISLPSDKFSGAAMNLGCMYATGLYCLRVDDDDIYGKYYVLDMVLQAQAVGADIFGKPPAPVMEEGGGSAYLKNSDIIQTEISVSDLTSGERWIGGNSMAFKRNIVESEIFSNNIYGAADTAFQLNISDEKWTCICADRFNLVAQRSRDISSHTWRTDFLEIVKNRDKCDDVSELFL